MFGIDIYQQLLAIHQGSIKVKNGVFNHTLPKLKLFNYANVN
jgi:hypothetical protein